MMKGALGGNFGKYWVQLWIVGAIAGTFWIYAMNREKIAKNRLGLTDVKN